MNKEVLFILRLPPPYGGGEIVSKILYNKLKSKYNFCIINRSDHNKYKQSRISIGNFYHGMKYLYKIHSDILKYNPRIIYLGLPKTLFGFLRNSLIILFANKLNIKIVVELHGMSFKFDKNVAGIYLLRFILKKIFAIRVLSNSIKDYISQYVDKRKIYIIENGIEIPSRMVNITIKNKFSPLKLLYIGAISDSKGFLETLNLMVLLKNEKIDVELNVVGEWISPSYKEFCENKIKFFSLNNIIFHGLLIGDNKWKVITQNDFHIHLSKFDGQPLTILETMGLGIPCFASKVGAIPEMINHGEDGFLIDNLNDIVDILHLVRNSKINYNHLVQNALTKFQNRFTSELMVSKIEKLISNTST